MCRPLHRGFCCHGPLLLALLPTAAAAAASSSCLAPSLPSNASCALQASGPKVRALGTSANGKAKALIVGGEPAPAYSYMAFYGGCSGTLIGDRLVLTAGAALWSVGLAKPGG